MDWDNEFDNVSPMEDDAYEQGYEDDDDGEPLIIGWLNYDNMSGSDEFPDDESLDDDNEGEDMDEWESWSDE